MEHIKKFTKKLIMPETQAWFNNCHSSTIVKTGENDYLCAYMAGEREGMPDMSIWLSRCEDGSWLKPERIMSIYRFAHWNPVLYYDGAQVFLYYKVGPTVPLWYTMCSVSDDLGKTWSVPVEAVPGDYSPRISARNKIIKAADGSLLGPCSVELERYWESYIDISRDGGKTWTKHQIPIEHSSEDTPAGGGEWQGLSEGALWENDLSTILKWDGIIQPTIWESIPGQFHALMRSTRGSVYRTDSMNHGETWSTAYPTCLPNNNSGIDAVKLEDGTVVLAYNPIAGNWTARSPVSLSISKDNGETFSEPFHMETQEGEFSYPAILADGKKVYGTYTYKRKSIVFFTFEID